MESATLDPRVEEFKDEAGEATGPMPERTPPDADGPSNEISVDGTGQLSFDVGGKAPTLSKLRVQGKAIEVEGQFEKGELIECRLVLKVGAVEFADQEDSSTGQVVDCARTAKARIVSFSRA